MTALIIAASVVAGLIVWAFIALTSIRLADLYADGLDKYDRGPVTGFAVAFAPLVLIVVLAFWVVRLVGGVGWMYRYTHPGEVRKKKRRAMQEQLYAERDRYRSLARVAAREGRSDEAELFRTVASDYERKGCES